MGTRADFYVGKGKDAEWLGSIAWDGYRDGIDDDVLLATNESAFRGAVTKFLSERDDATLPDQGWPWPWDDSRTSDCSYWFFGGKCWEAAGYPVDYFFPCDEPMPESDGPEIYQGRERVEFPNMAHLKNVTLGKRSGLTVLITRG